MANAAELSKVFERLDERVTNHIKFFWVVVGSGLLWLSAISVLLYETKSDLRELTAKQANVETINGRLDKLDAKLDAKLDKLEDVIKVISSQQSDQTQKLVHDLLATAKNTSSPELSTKAILAAASLTKTLQRKKLLRLQNSFKFQSML